MLAAFLLLPVAAENDKAQRKEAEDESVFFWFGDDLAVDDNPHRATAACHKIAIQEAISVVIEGSRKEIADGFAEDAGSHPSRSIPAGIGQGASRDANPYIIRVSAIFIHIEMRNGSAAAANGDGGRVGGTGGKNLRSSASRNPLLNGLDVCRVVGAGKQGRKREVEVAGLVGVEKIVARSSPTVSA